MNETASRLATGVAHLPTRRQACPTGPKTGPSDHLGQRPPARCQQRHRLPFELVPEGMPCRRLRRYQSTSPRSGAYTRYPLIRGRFSLAKFVPPSPPPPSRGNTCATHPRTRSAPMPLLRTASCRSGTSPHLRSRKSAPQRPAQSIDQARAFHQPLPQRRMSHYAYQEASWLVPANASILLIRATRPRARFVDTLRQQGMQPQQQVVFLSDGAETLRRLQ